MPVSSLHGTCESLRGTSHSTEFVGGLQCPCLYDFHYYQYCYQFLFHFHYHYCNYCYYMLLLLLLLIIMKQYQYYNLYYVDELKGPGTVTYRAKIAYLIDCLPIKYLLRSPGN